MKTAISVPDEVFESAEELAHRMGLSRSELYANALKSFVEKHRNDNVTDRLNEVYGGLKAGMDPALRSMQARSLRPAKW